MKYVALGLAAALVSSVIGVENKNAYVLGYNAVVALIAIVAALMHKAAP